MSIAFRVSLAAVILMSCAAYTRANDREEIGKTGRAFGQALLSGDVAQAKKYAITDERSDKMLEELAGFMKARQSLEDAGVAKFGEEGKTILPNRMGPQNFADWDKKFQEAKVDVNGDTATVTTPNSQRPTIFKKAGGRWKIDLKDRQGGPSEQNMRQISAMIGAIDQTTTEIKDGKYKTATEARQGLYQHIASAVGNQRGRPGPGGPPQQ